MPPSGRLSGAFLRSASLGDNDDLSDKKVLQTPSGKSVNQLYPRAKFRKRLGRHDGKTASFKHIGVGLRREPAKMGAIHAPPIGQPPVAPEKHKLQSIYCRSLFRESRDFGAGNMGNSNLSG